MSVGGVGWASCPKGLFVYPQCLAGPDVVIWGMNEALFLSGMRRLRVPHFLLQLLLPKPTNASLIIFAVTPLSGFFFFPRRFYSPLQQTHKHKAAILHCKLRRTVTRSVVNVACVCGRRSLTLRRLLGGEVSNKARNYCCN